MFKKFNKLDQCFLLKILVVFFFFISICAQSQPQSASSHSGTTNNSSSGPSADMANSQYSDFSVKSPQPASQKQTPENKSSDNLSDSDTSDLSENSDISENAAEVFEGKNKNTTEESKFFNAVKTRDSLKELTIDIKESLGDSVIARNLEKKEIMQLFGYDVFKQMNKNLSGNIQGPMGADYTVGPGDSFNIFIWGANEASFTTEINLEGDMILPKIGKISVAGLTFNEMKQVLEESFREQISQFEMSVVPLKQRKMRVFVLGEVTNPGVYELGGYATAYAAVFAAGGPSLRGGMRNLELKRGERKLADIDLYDFLMSGNRSTDIPLQEGDVIFIPLSGPRVTVSGAVKRPAIYELKPGENKLSEVIKMAGGIIPTGDVQKLQITRVVAHSMTTVFSAELSSLKAENLKDNDTKLLDMDKINVFSISPRNLEMVSLMGHVFEPGTRYWKPGMKLSDLIDRPDCLKKDPYLEYGEIRREEGIGGTTNILSFNPGKVLEKEQAYNFELFPRDQVIIFPASSLHEKVGVTIFGEVVTPGKYSLMPGMKVKDLIHAAGGLKTGVAQVPAEFTRVRMENGKKVTEISSVDIEKALSDDPKHNVLLKPLDTLVIRTIPDWNQNNYVTLSGEIKYTGQYTFQPGEKLSSLLKRAGGFTERAFLKGAVFKRKSVFAEQRTYLKKLMDSTRIGAKAQMIRNMSSKTDTTPSLETKENESAKEEIFENIKDFTGAGRVVINISEGQSFENSKYDMMLEPGDELNIPQKPSVITIEGAVNNPTSILWEEGKPLSYYLAQAGGISSFGNREGTCLIKVNGSTVTRQRRPIKCFLATKAEPGDAIWVPVEIRPYPEPFHKKIAPVAQILGNLAVTALAIQNASQ
ncbi:MAG: SLBB domain-containing protein [Candidatus Riflebacteria bacterium]|nr:SLBB domain-containing protein [Candidatus Riflebacteria bacterium]